jgi:lipopolysaccharide export LptBFGC system permease protein LptF
VMARSIVSPLSRYILRRHLGPFGVAFAALTALMLTNQILKQLPHLRGKGLPTSEIAEVFVLSVPFIVAVTLPMAVLLAVLRVFTRLATDSEISALSPEGVGILRLLRPVLAGSACVAALSFLWNDQILPRSNHKLRTLEVAIERGEPSYTMQDKSDREMTLAELRQASRSARGEADRAGADGSQTIERAARRRAATSEVEIPKKYSIAAACLVFALMGAPVGLRFPGRGIGLVTGVGMAVFTVFYVGLIGGEELGDRLMVSPVWAMWTSNIIVALVGLVALLPIRKAAHEIER